MDTPSLSQSRLDQIAEQFSAALRRGKNPSIEQYVAAHPGSNTALRRLLESVVMLEELKPKSASPSEGAITAADIRQLDDYTIVREIGRGGMGVVFEAIHQSLGRRVAVKVLSNSLLDDTKNLARFKREARAAARLRHTNIVPVFGVGMSDNFHYYVMDFIDGMSLREYLHRDESLTDREAPTIADTMTDTDSDSDSDSEFYVDGETSRNGMDSVRSLHPSTSRSSQISSGNTAKLGDLRWVARVGVTICDALQYAHSQNVLHRDIKPANLLLDRHGEIWIADFGLAKLMEQQPMTVTGDVIGTPQYMPPESFDGNYDVRSEVYGVALTLFELLTGRPAISGKNPADVIRRATEGVKQSPRRLNQTVPRDFETIVMKALAFDPQERYATAGEMRDDLQAFLDDRPISARPSGLIGRAVRWSRREPAIALLTATISTLLLALAVVSAAGYVQTSRALAIARQSKVAAEQSLQQRTVALKTADEQRLRAQKNLQVALAAFDEIMQNVGDRGLEPDADLLGEVTDTTSPDVSAEDAKLLQSLLVFFDQLAAGNSEQLLSESALAARRAGDIYLRLGQLREADRAYSEALTRYDSLSEHRPQDIRLLIRQAAIMNELAVITGLRGQLARAGQMFDQTLALLSRSDAAMQSTEGLFEYARAHRLFASHSTRIGLDSLRSASRPAPRSRYAPGRFPRNPLGAMMQVRTRDELSAVDESIRVLTDLTQREPENVRYRSELARAHRDRAKVASRANQPATSEQAIRRSIDLFEQLLKENPESEAIRYELAMTLSSTEAFSFNQMMRAVRADELSTALLAGAPDLPRYKALKAHTLQTLASHRQKVGRLGQVERHLTEAIHLYDSLIDDDADLNIYETQRARAYESMADLKLRRGDPASAIDYLQLAVDRLQPRLLRRPDISPVTRMQSQRMKQKLRRLREKS